MARRSYPAREIPRSNSALARQNTLKQGISPHGENNLIIYRQTR